jgi:hypothetical protein
MTVRTLAACLVLTAALLVAACGSGSNPASGTLSASKSAQKRLARPDDGLSAGVVSGIAPPGAGPQSVQVKFELKARPQTGQPLDIDLIIVPVYGNLERISGKVVGDDGLELIGGQDIPEVQKPVEGTPIRHSVRVLPKRDGVYTLTAVLLVDSAGQSTSQIFSAPVIADAATAESPARTASAAPASQVAGSSAAAQ